MSNDLPIFPKAQSLAVHTGNIVNWNRLKNRLIQGQGPTEELTECISSTIRSWVNTVDRAALQMLTDVSCHSSDCGEELTEEEKDALKVTVKVFLQDASKESIEEAITSVLADLDIEHIETILVALPECWQTLSELKATWEVMERLHSEEKVYTLGVSDLNKEQLEELYTAATVKPCVNQVNLASCCVMPPDLVAYAKEHHIQLLTHSDPKELLPASNLQKVIASSLAPPDGDGWTPAWIARYSVLIRTRGIVRSKGYIVKAVRRPKHNVLPASLP